MGALQVGLFAGKTFLTNLSNRLELAGFVGWLDEFITDEEGERSLLSREDPEDDIIELPLASLVPVELLLGEDSTGSRPIRFDRPELMSRVDLDCLTG